MDKRKQQLSEAGGDWTEPGPKVRCYLMVRRETLVHEAGYAEGVYEDAGPADVEKWAANRRPRLKLIDPEQEGFLCDAKEARDKAAARIAELESRCDAMTKQRNSYRERCAELEGDLRDAEEARDKAAARIAEVESLCDDMTKQRNSYRERCAELGGDLEHTGFLVTDDHERLLEAMQDTTAEQRIADHLHHDGAECDTCNDARAIGRFVDKAAVVTAEDIERAAARVSPEPRLFCRRLLRALLDKG